MRKQKFICRKCGERFVVEIIDREEAQEKRVQIHPVRCPRCRSQEVEHA